VTEKNFEVSTTITIVNNKNYLQLLMEGFTRYDCEIELILKIVVLPQHT